MKTILIRLFTFIMLMVFSVGAKADVKILYGEKGTEKFEGTGGKIEVTQKESDDKTQVTVYLTVTPDNGYTMAKDGLELYATIPANAGFTRAPEVSTVLTPKCDDFKGDTQKRTYYVIIASNLALWVKSADFQKRRSDGAKGPTYTYYALHNKDKGYLKQAKGAVANDGTFRAGHVHDDNGFSIWVLSSDGYLQQEMYYLNVANDQTLYLSTEKVTRWDIDNTTASGKNYLKPSGSSKYLCADNGPQLKESPSNYYNACEMTITESNFATSLTDVSFTVQSPQLVTYLRTYYKRKIVAKILTNDNGETNKTVANNVDNRCYCSLEYSTTSDTNKEVNWDINETSGIIYSKKNSGDYSVVATYMVAPLDPIVLSSHDATNATVTLKLNPSPFAPDAAKNYLLYYTKEANYRFPYNDGLNEDDPVKTDANKNVLTDPDTNPNQQISWKVFRDDEGFYSFQSINTNRWLRYDENHYVTGSDYGVIEMGIDGADAPTDAAYKFRLYKSGSLGNGSSQPTYCILPYCKQYAVYKSDGVLADALTSLNVYTTPKVISLWKAGNDSKYCIFAYEAEYRIRGDFTVTGPATANALGIYDFTADSYYYRAIKGSATSTDAQRDLEIKDSYEVNSVDFNWTVEGLDGYYSTTQSVSKGKGTLHLEITSLPASGTLTGTIKAQAKAYTDNNDKKKSSGWKTAPFVLYPSPTPTSAIEISSLASITNANGVYKLTADVSDMPGVAEFNGFLDGDGHHIRSLSGPLFTTLTNATIRNLTIDKATISESGTVGAIASTADGGTVIYNVGLMGGSVASTDNYCGGLVGLLKGTARVINCFSYANITGGTNVGGIVGYNNETTTSTALKTMVMNCMFYGDITGGTNKAPIYNGKIITNRGDQSGVSNFNYFWGGASYVTHRDANNNPDIQTYNCALLAETRFLQRFEFFRHVLNGHRELAAWWATGSADNKDLMMKWVLEPSQIGTDHPYPVLKAPKDANGDYIQYPSVVNIDAANAEDFANDAETKKTQYNQGRKFGTLTINIQNASSGNGSSAPDGANITTTSVTPNITDKDPAHFNFNYYKVQLPYYNDVGTKNYTGNKVVTGWKIVTISDGTHSFSEGSDASATVDGSTGDITLTTPYNFADRKCTNKDLYSVSERVFSQGAYFDVPEGVTSITIEPYWAKCVYVADAYSDVVYNQAMNTSYNVTTVGGGQIWTNDKSYSIAGDNQKIYTSMSTAVSKLNPSGTVYDNAIVLVGNVHSLDVSNITDSKPYTIMSIDLDKDNEPDYSYILRFDSRVRVHPVRVDFLNVIGLGMAQKSNGGTGTYNFGIMQPLGWFEVTNTGLFRVTQFEYDKTDRKNAPMILHGGVIEQWVTVGGSETNITEGQTVTYYHVGGNVWFKEFHIGVHQDKTQNQFVSPHPPISVTGGDFNEFYLTGLYNTPNANYDDNAECYINGGHFGKVAGTGMQGIGNLTTHDNGNIIWQIDNADIDEFYAGGINAAHIAEGNIWTVISNSRVDQFCGGPKFGDMNSDKKVVTNATNCTFRTFFGAGYGGNSYNRYYPSNKNNVQSVNWNTWLAEQYKNEYSATYNGVQTRIDYQFLPNSGNTSNVARLFVDYVSFSLATTCDVTSKLTGCTITTQPLGTLELFEGCIGNFYGGGSLGKVEGPVKSILTDCTVEGNVFGAGYSASLPPVAVMNNSFQTEPYYDPNLGAYLEAKLPATVSYEWAHAETVNNTATAIDTGNKKLYTTENLEKSNLGSVNGAVTLTIGGDSKIGTEGDATKGNVFGGGDESYVVGSANKITVTLKGNAQVYGNVYGGGDEGLVQGSTEVNIQAEAPASNNNSNTNP